ncbi:type III glutamate--ammonia ligase [Capillimicrobium parvum]|uniref:Glutamate--methylamine ligase n=1 Tax=Capillimicrobium parvum TaxID=2884022 RepID=A0A9E6XU16_9ACTN|nr:type III glutamate--ammonia ligase [Capillimicrobium parvum]UGS34118.1 Glutamate--methylamine ligase [Capillimicrobium parvum]
MSTPSPLSGTIEVPELPDEVQYVAVQWVDVHGASKAKIMPRAAFPDACAPGGGAGFAAFANHGFARGPEHPEFLTVPDPSTLLQLPHRPEMAVVFGTVMDGDAVATCDARSILARVQAMAAERGLAPIAGMEPEFFLLRENESGTLVPYDALDVLDKPCYDLKALLRVSPVLTEIVGAMETLEWPVSALDHEDANGQYEINYMHADALTTADRFTLLRTIIADIADRHGAIATFMPKPLAGRTGSGGHVHMSAQADDGSNPFADDGDPRGLGLSRTAYSFIAGVLDHARALSALAMPTVNSYRRLYSSGGISGASWAPDAIVYGANNRTVMLRVPGSGRFENRAVDAACNPYLALAGMVAAGLDGVERGLDPGAPMTGMAQPLGVPTLPRTLAEALDVLELDTVMRDALGEEAISEFIAVKRAEWGSYMESVSAWEQNTYLRRT